MVFVKIPCGCYILSSEVFTLKNARKVGENLSFTGNFSFFFKKVCFPQPLSSYRNDFVPSLGICQITMWILMSCSLLFFMFDNTRKNRPKLFFSLEILTLFSKSCVFNNLLIDKEMIFLLGPYMPK